MNTIVASGFSAMSTDGELESLAVELKRLADLGADSAELCLTTVDLISGGRIIRKRAERLVALTREFPLQYTVHGLVSGNLMDPATAAYQVAATKALIEVCDMIDARIVVQHSGGVRADQTFERAQADRRERDALHELAEFARPYGIRVALENIFTLQPGMYTQTPSEVAATVKAVRHPNLIAVIDFAHAYIEATYRGLDFREEVRAMAPVVGHLHLSDCFGRPYGDFKPEYPAEETALGIGDVHLPLGWGDIPWDDIFDEFHCLPGSILVMEIGRRWRNEQADCLTRARELAALVNNRDKAAP